MKVTKVTKVNPVIASTTVKRRTKHNQYKSDIDPAVIIHSSKTHRSVSEAFRDADYASAFWRFPTEWERTREVLQWAFIWGGFLFVMYLFMGFFK